MHIKKFLLFFIPLLFLLNLQGFIEPSHRNIPIINQKSPKPLPKTTHVNFSPTGSERDDNDLEIMPSWPPITSYRKDILTLKSRNFIKPPGKVAYLTFDDGPSPNTPKILAILKGKNVKATFFVIGLKIKEYPNYLKMEYQEGNAIGNHSWDHVYANIYRSPDSLLDEATKTNDLMEKVIGIRTPLFRAPGGTLGNLTVGSWNLMDSNNYLIYDWNVSSGDGSPVLPPQKDIIKNILTQARYRDEAVILMHDSPAKPTTLAALPEVIDGLRQEGFTFAVLGPDVKPVQFLNVKNVKATK